MRKVGHKTASIYRRYAIVDEAMLKEGAELLASFNGEQPTKAASGEVGK
jgi:hypothetical protein